MTYKEIRICSLSQHKEFIEVIKDCKGKKENKEKI